MTDTALHRLGAKELARRISAREVTSAEATEEALRRAATLGAEHRVFVVLDEAGARRAAEESDRRIARGSDARPLEGVPITIKDLMLTRGMATTAGSQSPDLGLSERRDAPVVRRLRRAGAVVLGKTNLNEFAYGVTGENAHFGQVPNPWDNTRMSGGSSSGSGAALALGIGYGSVGTDTRGSIRIPASCCGVSGIKPTRGLVPTEDVFPLSWTLDHVGPMARSAEDLALLLGVMAGGHTATRLAAALEGPVAGLTLGVPSFYFRDVHREVAAAVRAALALLAEEGIRIVEIEIPELDRCLRASAVIAASEGLSVHDRRLRDGAEGYGAPVLARLESAYAFTGVELALAEATRRELVEAYERAFGTVDLMAGPTLPGLPAPIGSSTMDVGSNDEGIVDASCRLVAPQNMTGVPAASVPCGFSADGLPIGLQIWAGHGRDDLVLAVAHRYQQRTEWHGAFPGDARPAPRPISRPAAEDTAAAAPA